MTIEPMSWVPKRPSGLPVRAEYIPRLLHKLMGWVLWRYERRKRKWTKVPFRPDGNRASTTDPRTWSDFGTVLNAYRERAWDGIGFVLSAYPDLVGIDLDKCRDTRTGVTEAWAQEIMEKLNSCMELSPSGTGVKIWVKRRDWLFSPASEFIESVAPFHTLIEIEHP